MAVRDLLSPLYFRPPLSAAADSPFGGEGSAVAVVLSSHHFQRLLILRLAVRDLLFRALRSQVRRLILPVALPPLRVIPPVYTEPSRRACPPAFVAGASPLRATSHFCESRLFGTRALSFSCNGTYIVPFPVAPDLSCAGAQHAAP